MRQGQRSIESVRRDDDSDRVAAGRVESLERPQEQRATPKRTELFELALRTAGGALAPASCGEDRRRTIYPRTSSSIFSASSSLQFLEKVSSETRI